MLALRKGVRGQRPEARDAQASSSLTSDLRPLTSASAPAAGATNGVGKGIPVWHLVISGFTQTLEKPSGCQNLWEKLRSERSNGETVVDLEPWNADWAGIAELIWRFRPARKPPRVFCYAYSWGGGWGFPQLAGELLKRGIEIQHAVLCDAVYRPKCRLFLIESLLRSSRVIVPANVREVDWFYQREGLPMGHEVVAADPEQTDIHPGVQIFGVTHHYMDDQSCWWEKCREVARNARREPRGGKVKMQNAK